jgi:poly(3-hydroxybutyrate) depolymerase
MRVAAAVLLLLLGVAASSHAEDGPDAVVRKWLVLAPVDVVARRPLRPDAVFAKHLLDRASRAPKAGEEIVGTLGNPAKWETRDADEKGEIETAGGSWAYASVESASDRVAIARLEGASTLFVNGAGFTGDVYRLGDAGVPVALRKGSNDVYVAGPRGGFRVMLGSPRPGDLSRYVSAVRLPPGITVDASRTVVADRHERADPKEPPASFRLWNATSDVVWKIPPLGTGTFKNDVIDRTLPKRYQHLPMRLQLDSASRELRGPSDPWRQTFISAIDGSVQSYALLPPARSDLDKSRVGLVLSLHGAGVDCMDQARAYAPKPDFWIVCPTNRGRFGFDWQDWGRLDAYEVLEDALKVTGVDPRRVYLTGHSMGGHGTWHLAANDPLRFLAIAPSAGWSSFESYGGSTAYVSPLAWMWRAADGASRTLDLAGNLAQIPTYVLHGEKDDNVPLSEAQLIVDAVTKAGGKPEFHVEPGAGHWWDKDGKRAGADCVDWPGIWELFRRTQPRSDVEMEIRFTSMDLSVDAPTGLIRVLQAIDYGRPCSVRAMHGRNGRFDFNIATENVRRFDMDCTHPIVLIDGVPVEGGFEPSFVRGDDGRWSMSPEPAGPTQKNPHRSGPFKQAFTNRFVLVYGTAGDDAEDRELLEKARHDSEVWAYRANGDVPVLSDAEFLAGEFKDRNVIVYGNADTNAAWSAVFAEDCPITAKRGAITVGGAKHEGVVAAAFVRPRKGSDVALAAAFADTGAKATRLFYQFPVFSSGVGIPDYVVFGPGFLAAMDGDVRAAGWFDHAWRLR